MIPEAPKPGAVRGCLSALALLALLAIVGAIEALSWISSHVRFVWTINR